MNAPKPTESKVTTKKIDWNDLTERAEVMKSELTEAHAQITAIWPQQKCRELGTVESSIRNAVNHLDRLPDAIKRYYDKDGKGGSSKKAVSYLSKPRA